MQLNTRITPELDGVLAAAMEQRGLSKRDAVEEALRVAYPEEWQAVERRSRGL
ncbi:hypothetical protein ABZ513_31830 [Streptomyces bacillaris]|uniref:hypothetical protein n=1 Tax=Streptomyces bacillaris TaxID=68179 RepID=UPI003461059D